MLPQVQIATRTTKKKKREKRKTVITIHNTKNNATAEQHKNRIKPLVIRNSGKGPHLVWVHCNAAVITVVLR